VGAGPPLDPLSRPGCGGTARVSVSSRLAGGRKVAGSLGRVSLFLYLSLCLLVVSVTISGLSMVVPEHSGDPGEPDRQCFAFGWGQSVQQLSVLGVQFLPDPRGRRLPVVGKSGTQTTDASTTTNREKGQGTIAVRGPECQGEMCD
jgi:hypothetical protein